jgi:exodeoxyribonuclease VII small subunit
LAEQELTYEQARDELLRVVQQLESGGASLAESMALWQRGEKLAEICQGFLDGAKEQVAASRSNAS